MKGKAKSPGSGKRPAPRQRLSAARIVRAGIVLADRQGLESLTMRGLAERLGVEAMSLYHHLANKEALLDGMVESVMDEIGAPPKDQPWKAAMRTLAHSSYRVLSKHPWAPLLLLSRLNVGPAMLRYHEAVQGCLVKGGFSPPTADHARNLVESHVYGFTLQEIHFPIRPEEYARAAGAFLPSLPAATFPHLRALTEAVAKGEFDGRNQFGFGLDIILDGLERLLHAKVDPKK